MDKQTTDYRLQTTDYRLPTKLQPAVCGLQSAVCILAMLALFPIAGHAATDTSDTTAGTQSESSTPLSRAIEAGKAASKRALSSKAKAASAEAVPAKVEKTEPTDFQKKIAAIAQGETSGTGNTLSDFATKAAPVAKKVVKKEENAKAKAPETEAEKVPMVEIAKKGTITGVSRQGFALEYAVDKKAGGMEIWFNYGEGMKLGGMGDASELGEGDTVYVVYDQAPNNSRHVKEISLLQKKPAEPAEAEEM